MEIYYLINNISIKFFIFFLIANVNFEEEIKKEIKKVNDLEDYFSQSICQFLYFTINYKCIWNFYKNVNFYNDILKINNNINLLMNINNSKLENIILLLGIIPYLKNNSTLSYKIKDKEIYYFFKKILNKTIKHKIIIFSRFSKNIKYEL